MGVVEIVLLIVALKIPIVGLFWLVWWAAHPAGADQGPAKEPADLRPHMPPPLPPRGPRRRGPHGGAAARPPVPHADGGRTRGPATAPRPRRIPQTARGD